MIGGVTRDLLGDVLRIVLDSAEQGTVCGQALRSTAVEICASVDEDPSSKSASLTFRTVRAAPRPRRGAARHHRRLLEHDPRLAVERRIVGFHQQQIDVMSPLRSKPKLPGGTAPLTSIST
jgi:hypothetical protein